ncbi:SDR family NAD(P)-dependent oxidoreductase [Streptomyces edwardsiae]|uniref:SDR family NAD(P)-dependent oxidoreductase n=1 Tax=Streptomyces edwardsiae TaxID=3075527 RepID=A0ABU2QBC1_9ACTN|nr:SDR family NAD(P)-dependent oxidoreductase [Streptomyces sp. DSM 41635]MDT0401740.1 SDR family NAD(P)-dependent oxidoreductase [Streptomyces sp. DSM 41635]
MQQHERAVAVVGVGCRLPGGITDLDGLWSVLRDGRDMVGEMPADRLPRDRTVDPGTVRPGRSYTAAGGFLDDVASFDAAYFGMSPAEARHIDPQQRLLLEMTADALDDAALPAGSLAGSDTCVYVGVSDPGYGVNLSMMQDHTSPHTMPGATLSITANRMSYTFDLRGPSMAVDTACSSALVALDRACRTLREGSSRVALAGGVNVLSNPYSFAGFSYAGMLSRRGRCAAFSADADGFVRAEGGAVLVLKRLADALADGDRVHAVLAATGNNTDGRSTGMIVPSAETQEALLHTVYAEAGIGADDLVYVEAHGTGTQVGDPAEAEAIGRALGRRRRGGPLPIGSVKSNVGHLEPASGMAGLLKAILVLRHGLVPATLHALPLNPRIDFDGLGLAPAVDPVPLEVGERAAVGVSAFGFGGANAHAVVTPPPAPRRTDPHPEPDGRPLPVVVSARSPKALEQLTARMAERLRHTGPGEFYDVARTSTVRRTAHPHRAAVLAADPRDAARQLDLLAAGRPAHGATVRTAERDGTAFVYSGNASQWPGMAADLLEREPAFRRAVEEADAALAPHLGWSVAKELAHPSPGKWPRTEIAQPALFAVQVGLTALLASHGIRPRAVTGHSVGEVAAAHTAGVLTLEQAALVIAARSRTQGATAGRGRMAAVGLPEAQAREELRAHDGALELAGINSDRDVTIAGDADALAAWGAGLTARGVFFRELDLDYAFHSRAMDPIREPLLDALAGLEPAPARVPFLSTVTGTPLAGPELDAGHWWRNVREPVRFAEAAQLAAGHAGVLVEIGPHPVLRPYLRHTGATCVPTLRRDGNGPRETASAVAAVLAADTATDWRHHFPRPGRVADLPAYAWQRERYWHGTAQDLVAHTSGSGLLDHPLVGERMPAPHHVWHGTVEPQLVPWLGDHRIGDDVLMPAAAYVEMALSAGRRALDRPVEVRHLEIGRPLSVPWPDPTPVALQTAVTPEDGALTISVREEHGGACLPVVRAQVRTLLGTAPAPLDVDAVRARCDRRIDGPGFYRTCHGIGLNCGPDFQLIDRIDAGDGEVLVGYRLTHPADDYTAHPVLIDAPLQATVALAGERAESAAFLPTVFGAVRVWRTPAPTGVVHLRRRSRGANEICWDITYADPDGTVTVEIDGCRTRRGHLTERTPLTVQRTVLRAAPHPGSPAAPSPLPAPTEVARAAGPRIAAARTALDDTGHRRFTATAAQAGAHRWAETLRGLLTDPTAPFTMADLVTGGTQPRHRRLVRLLLPLLAEHGLVRQEGENWRLTDAETRSGALLRNLVEDHPAYGARTLLLNRQLRHLPAVLRGHALLPAGDGAHEQLHETDPAHRFTHRAVQALLGDIVARWPADRPLRVLEFGATTTALTAAVLPLLPADRTRYTCTAATAGVLTRAEHRFAAHDFVDRRVLDPDADLIGQGLPPGGFDLVLAGDALHATTDLAATLRRLRTVLAPGGHLLATEPHHAALQALLSGTSHDFWERADHALRPASRILPRDRWAPLLERCGFTGVALTGPEDRSVLHAAADQEPGPAPGLPRSAASWVIVAEDDTETAAARALAAHLGEATVVTTPGRRTAPPTGSDPHIVLLLAEPAPYDTVERTTRRAATLRSLAAACDDLDGRTVPRMWLVTRPTGLFPAPEAPSHPADAAVWAACRTLANERPDLALRRLSCHRTGDPAADARRLAAELLAPADQEDEIVLTAGGRFVPRQLQHPADEPPAIPVGRPYGDDSPAAPAGTRHTGEPPATPADTPYILEARDPGLRRRLIWRETEPAEPGPGEVALEMRAVALNYRDPMRANGLLPPEAVENSPIGRGLGTDGAGVVRAVGEGVRNLKPGDRVCGLVPAALASHATTPATALLRIPEGMSFAEAATFPVAFLTVHQTLVHQAGLDDGETVLVHGGAGAVGLAVLQCARRQGARVIATAGTETKRDLLRTLGVEHVLDSRSLDFVPRVRELTGGRGVDVVVNSLSGEAIAQGLDLLAPGGRFIELGKKDIFLNNPVTLRPFHRSLTFIGFNLDAVIDAPKASARLLAAFEAEAVAGTYRPLPHTTYPAARVDEAFHLLQHSRHTGKVVVTFDPLDEPVPVEPAPRTLRLDGDGTYLITGGLSGLGAATAHLLADRGARHLALLSRSGPGAPGAPALLQALTERGVHATAHAADVTDEAALRRVLDTVDAGGHPLRGVVHAAMHMDDAALADVSDDRFAAVLAPKAQGAAVLDRLTTDRDLDLFLTCSSVSAAIGNPGQSAYAAANAHLEALVRARRAAGRTGTALAWGPIGETGYVARGGMESAMAARGLEPLTPAEVLTTTDRLLAAGTDVAGAGRYRWGTARPLLPALATPRFALLAPASATPSPDARNALLATLADLPADEAVRRITDVITRLLAAVLQTDPAGLDPTLNVTDHGLDSLLGMQFLVQARDLFDIRLGPADLATGRTPAHFARLIHQRLDPEA